MAEHHDEPKLLPDNAPADTLHAHVEKHISLPDAEKFENEPLMNELTAHPNLASHSIEGLYNHMMEGSSPEMAEQGHSEPYSHEWADNLLNHPNAPAHIKKDYLKRTFHPDNPASDTHLKLADQGVATEDELRELSDKAFKAGETPHTYSRLHPDYYMQHFKEGSQNPEAQEGIGAFGLEGLLNSERHTPESLDRTIDAIHANKYHNYDAENDKTANNAELFSRMVRERGDLSKDQLNRISQMLDSTHDEHRYSKDDAIEEILKHGNTDPSLLAKYATAKDATESALSHPNLPKQSMDAFVRRIKKPNDYGQKNLVNAFLSNPSITKEHVQKLIAAGSKDAIHHGLADEQSVRDLWNGSGKSTDDARNILSAKNIPPDILKDLVNHKNQDIALKALDHPKADMEVVQEGLARKAKAVQDAARLHPLVADQQAREGLTSGKTSLSKVYDDGDFQEHFDRMPKKDQDEIFANAHQKYTGTDLAAIAKSTKERPETILHSKMKMAMDSRVSPEIRDKQSKDIVSMFKKTVGSNKEIAANKSHILNDGHDDHSRLVNAVAKMAKSGDKGAQSAILSNPAMMQGLSNHMDLNEAPPQFLEDAYRQAVKYGARPPNIYDRHGRPQKFDRSDVITPIFRSDSLPNDVFHEIATNKDLMKEIGAGDEFKRYDELPENEQKQRYTEILNSGSPEAAKSVIQTKAPNEIYDRALAMLSPSERDDVLSQHMAHVKVHRPDLMHAAAVGQYNAQNENTRGGIDSDAQSRALSHLDANNVNDLNVMKQVISIPAEDSVRHVPDDRLLDNAGSLMQREELLQHAVQSGRLTLAHKALGRKIASMSEKMYGQGKEERAADMVTDLQHRANTMPSQNEMSDNPVASNWNDMILNSKDRYSYGKSYDSAVQKLRDAGANLDFLGSMPGMEGQTLRRTALKYNLLSDEAVSQIAKTGSLRDVLSIANDSVKRLAMDSWLEKPDLTPEDLGELASSMSHSLLNSDATTGGRSQSMSSHAYDEYHRKLTNIVDKIAEKNPDKLSQVIRNALKSNSNVKDLTKSDKEKIAKDITEHVASKAYATPTDRNRTMYDTYKALKSQELTNTKDQSRLESQVLESKDFETLVNMAEEGNLSDKGMDALNKAARQPETLSSGEIAGLSTRLDSNSEPQTVVNMAKTFEAKLAQEAAAGNTRNQTASKIKFVQSIGTTFSASANSSEENKVKNEFVINYTKKLAQDPAVAPHANSSLLRISANLGATDVDKAMDLMASLPESRDAFHDYTAPSITKAFANNPRFMEMAQSGWRLDTLVESADKLTGENSSILVNRSLSETGAGVDKLRLLRNLEDNNFVQPEDSVKLGRTLDHAAFSSLVNGTSRDSALSGNLVYVAHSRMQDLEALAKDPNLAAHGAPHMGHEHREAIMQQLESMSMVVAKSAFDQDMTNKSDKLAKVGELINGIHSHTKNVMAALRKDAATSGYNMDIGKTHARVKAVAASIADTNLQLDRDDALKAFDLVNEFHSLDKAANLNLTKPEDTFSIVQNIVEKAENLEDQDWRDVFSKTPHAVYSLSKRSTIPTEALASVDYDAIEKAPDGDDAQHSMFAVESAQWFGKMSSADRKTHGKNLMEMFIRMQADGKLRGVSYSKPMLAAIPHMANDMTRDDVVNMMVGTKSHDIAQSLFREAVKCGAGGEEALKMYVRDHKKIMGEELFKNVKDFGAYQSGQLAQTMEPVLKSPYINEDISGRVCAMFVSNPGAMESAMNSMLANKATPQSAVARMADQVISNAEAKHSRFDESMGLSLANQILQHPNIDETRFMKLGEMSNEEYGRYIAPEDQFNPALLNPTHGGKLFRSMPVVVPEVVPNVDSGKTVTSLNVKSDEYNKMRDIMGLIPAEGMAWAEFKKKFPQQERSLPKSVRDVFMSANNKPVMPEQFATAMRSMDDSASKYHITFSHWSSPLQRHRGKDQKPNLVIQVNNSAEKEKELSSDPKLWALYQHLLQDANGIDAENNKIGLHPTTPHLVSWSRVDTDQEKGHWVIEEYQSDFAQKFRANINALINESPSGMTLNGQAITAEDMKNYAKTIGKHVEDWGDASMQAVIQNAKAQGVKKLYMHGAEVRGAMSSSDYTREFWDNKNTRPQTSGFRKIYDEGPRKYGFQECDYTDYPKYSAERVAKMNEAKLSTKCWVLHLDAPDQRPKKKKA